MFEPFRFPTGIEFEVDGKIVPVNRIWAHTKTQPRGRTAGFRFTVPTARLEDIFSPKTPKPVDQRWPGFVQADLNDMRKIGMTSLSIQCWLSQARACEHLSHDDIDWVICSITEVIATDDGLVLVGVAEEFRRDLY